MSTSSKHSADSGLATGAVHEEWETASESSDVLKDSDLQQQSQSTRGDKYTSIRRDSRRGYSSQRHTQSRRGRYRDHPSADVGSTSVAGGSSGSVGAATRQDHANNASVTSENNSAVGQSAGQLSNPNGRSGNLRVVYRVDQVVFDDPAAVEKALSDVYMRCVFL